MGEFNCLQCLQSLEIIDYNLNTYLNKLFMRNEKINILSVPFINLNFLPSSGAKKGSLEWHFDHFIS